MTDFEFLVSQTILFLLLALIIDKLLKIEHRLTAIETRLNEMHKYHYQEEENR